MIYDKIPEFDKEPNDLLLNYLDENEQIQGLLSLVYNGNNYNVAMQKSIEFAQSESELIAGNAIGCFGDIARIYKKLDLEIVGKILKERKQSQSEWIKSKVKDSIDDISIFLKIKTSKFI